MLNFTPPNFQVLVGNLDVTNAVTSISIKRNQWAIGKPICWSGTIELVELDVPFKLSESLDDWVNKSRWARGQIVYLYVKNKLFCTLRIVSYFYNEDDRVSSIEVGQLLDLLDYDSVPKDYEGLGFKPDKSISLIELVTKLLKEAGIINFSRTVGGVFNRDFVPPNHTGGSFISLACKYLNERLIWLYHAPNETVQLCRYPTGVYSGNLLFTRARNEIEDYRRSQTRELPCNVVTVTGGGEEFHTCEKDEEEQVELGYGTNVMIVTGTMTPSETSTGYVNYKKITKPYQTYQDGFIGTEIKTWRARSVLIPSGDVPKWVGDLSALVLSEETINKKYFDDQGRLTKEESITNSIKCVIYPSELFFYDDENVFNSAYREEITYSSKLPNQSKQYGDRKTQEADSAIIRQKRQVKYAPFLTGRVLPLPDDFNIMTTRISSKYIPQIQVDILELIIETWEEQDKKKECNFYKYTKKVFKRKQAKRIDKNFLNTGKDYITYSLGGLTQDTKSGTTSENATPPSWDTRPPIAPTKSVNLNVEKNFDTPGVNWQNANEDNERRLEYQCNTLISETEAQTLAEFLGKSQLHAYYAREISLPLFDSDEFLNNPTPFNRAYFDKGSYVLSSESVVIVENEAELAFVGLFERGLSSAVPDRPTLLLNSPPLIPIEPTPENPNPIQPTVWNPNPIQPTPENPYPTQPEPINLPDPVPSFPVRSVYSLPVNIKFIESQEAIGDYRLPDVGYIVVDNLNNISVLNDGNVETTGGYNFKEIVTYQDRVLCCENNLLISRVTPFSQTFWDSILTMDNEEITIDKKVLTMM